MLVLSRKPGEKICIGDTITITVAEVIGNRVRIALEAPPEVHILRAELCDFLPSSPRTQPNHEVESDACLKVMRSR
jgi:carbon storage regulator